MDKILGYRYSSVDSKNRVCIPQGMRERIDGELAMSIVKGSVLRLYDLQKVYTIIEEIKKGNYSEKFKDNVENIMKELCPLLSNLVPEVKFDANGRIMVPITIANQAGTFDYVKGDHLVKIIGEGSTIALVPNQRILNNYEEGLYAEDILRR